MPNLTCFPPRKTSTYAVALPRSIGTDWNAFRPEGK
jgi:hypothetical protein